MLLPIDLFVLLKIAVSADEATYADLADEMGLSSSQVFRASHDLEDVIAVVDGRESLVDEVLAAAAPVVEYIQEQLADLLQEHRFIDALPGHVLESGREEIVRERLERISQSK